MTTVEVAVDQSTIDLYGLEEVRRIQRLYPLDVLGPTWARDANGDVIPPDPRRSLGLQVAGWCSKHLRALDGEGNWRFTPEQLRFLIHYYAVNDLGERSVKVCVLQRLKGWGKDPLGMVIALAELLGPVRFSHWEDGWAIGKPVALPWVQVAAVSKDQTRNASNLIPVLLKPETRQKYSVSQGVDLIRARGGEAFLEMVPASPESLQGRRSTFVLADEIQHWLPSNRGRDMWETAEPNAAKVGGHILAITNAYLPGEESVGEVVHREYNKIQAGEAADRGLMIDSISAPPDAPMEEKELRCLVPMLRGDSVWLKIENVLPSLQSTSLSLSTLRRMWLNQSAARDDALYTPGQIAAVCDESLVLRKGDPIVLGFDGAKSDDSTALVAVRTTDFTAHLVALWEAPPRKRGWKVDTRAVDAEVHRVFRDYNVQGFYADLAYWDVWVHEWEQAYGDDMEVRSTADRPIAWDMRGRHKAGTQAHEMLLESIFEEKLRIADDVRLRRHIQNAVRRENAHGVSFSKASADSPDKVDAYAALMLAVLCYHDRQAKGSVRIDGGLVIH